MAEGKQCKCSCNGKYHGMGSPNYIGIQKRIPIWFNEDSKDHLDFGEHFKPDKTLLKLIH